MSELDPLDQQLSLAWRELSPPDGLEARVRARLATGSGGSPVSTVAKAASRARALRASGSLGVGVGGALLVLGFIAGYWSRPSSGVIEVPGAAERTAVDPAGSMGGDPVARDASARDTVARDAVASGPVAPADGVDAIAPPVTREPKTASTEPSAPGNDARERPRPRARNHRAAPAPASEAGRELSLLARAERAVRAKNPELALALIQSFDELRPGAALNEERNAIELMARCQAGDASSAALKQAFAKRYPRSVYVERIEGECASQAALREPPVAPSKATTSPVPDINMDEGGNHAQSETH